MDDANNTSLERPTGPSRQIVATVRLPSRNQGVTIIVDDADGGDRVSFFVDGASGSGAVGDEFSSLPVGALVEWNGGVIEVTEIQGESTVVFTLWDL